MIIDTSALIAILRDEPEAADYATAIEAAPRRHISAADFLETAIVIDGSGDPVANRRFDDLVREALLVVEPFTEAQARIARDIPGFWTRQRAPRASELWRLLRLCLGALYARAALVQG